MDQPNILLTLVLLAGIDSVGLQAKTPFVFMEIWPEEETVMSAIKIDFKLQVLVNAAA